MRFRFTTSAACLRQFGHNDLEPNIRLLRTQPAVAESTVRLWLQPVLAFCRCQAGCGNDVAPMLYDQVRGRSTSYLAFLEHTAGRKVQRRPAVRVRLQRRETPVLSPELIADLLETEATYSPEGAE